MLLTVCRTALLLIVTSLLTSPWAAAAEPLDPAKAKPDEKGQILWYSLQDVGVEGRGWTDTKAFFNRLPAKAEGVAPKSVWGLSQHSAGLCARFTTDAPQIQARWTLTSKRLEMVHMTAIGVSGLDLYALDNGKWKWLAVGRPTAISNTVTLVSDLPAGSRDYCLYLPLYNGVTSVEIGIPKGSTLTPLPRPADHQKPVVFYGTSITQGGCASRPGMVHTAILGRWLDCPVINLGFSGSGRMEPEMGDLIAELDPAVFVLDCLPNMDAKLVTERVVPFVHKLRKAHPQTPIVLVEDRNYTSGFLRASQRTRNEQNHAALRKAYEGLLAEGVGGLSYLPADKLLGDDGEGTVDSSHPTDLGFYRQAKAMLPVLQPLVEKSRKK